jgi:hypothetical protein
LYQERRQERRINIHMQMIQNIFWVGDGLNSDNDDDVVEGRPVQPPEINLDDNQIDDDAAPRAPQPPALQRMSENGKELMQAAQSNNLVNLIFHLQIMSKAYLKEPGFKPNTIDLLSHVDSFVFPQHQFTKNDNIKCIASDLLVLLLCIEHYMLGVILGRGGGPEELGATFWGQTELSCYDDSQHGIWA